MTTLLYIRYIQIKRELLDTAWLGLLVMFVVLSFLITISFVNMLKTPHVFYFTGALFLGCVGLQLTRIDKSFVHTNIDRPHLNMYVEYVALTFPFSIAIVCTAHWYCYLLLVVALYVVPFIKHTFTTKNYFKKNSSFFSASNFEWISGFRKSYLILIPLYLLAIGFCWFKILPLFILWMTTFVISSFYTECESLQILRAEGLSSKKFMQKKLLQHTSYILLLNVPILLINTAFNLDYWFINLLFVFVQLTLVCFVICLKYSSYIPNNTSTPNGIMMTMVMLGTIIPFLLPIPFLLSIYHYRKVIHNLRFYLHD